MAMARLSQLRGLSPNEAPAIPTSRLVPSNALYVDVQLVLKSGLRMLDTQENSMSDAPATANRPSVLSKTRLLFSVKRLWQGPINASVFNSRATPTEIGAKCYKPQH